MPVITFKYQDLKDLGIDMEKDELIDTLPMMASDIEDYDDEEIKVEFFPNQIVQITYLLKEWQDHLKDS